MRRSVLGAYHLLVSMYIPVRFYRTMLCIRGTSHGPVSVRLSVRPFVRPSVTSRSPTETAKHRITQTTSHDSPGTLVFWCQRSPRNSTKVTPYVSSRSGVATLRTAIHLLLTYLLTYLRGRQMQVGWVEIGDFRQITGYISKTAKDRHIVSIKAVSYTHLTLPTKRIV